MDGSNRAESPVIHGDLSEVQGKKESNNSPPADMTHLEDKPTALTGSDEASRLRELQADIRDQDDLEKDISRQVLSILLLCY